MSDLHFGILVLFGFAVLGGALGAWFFQKIRFPQVVGYIVFGIVIGETGLGIIGEDTVHQLQSFNWFALGLIGFLVGGELRMATFREYGKQFVAILLAEGMLAFLLVGAAVTGVVYYVSGNFAAALATGIVFGAIASATDPASTVDVLWEYRSRGVLTAAVVAVVALDDALAMTLYGLGTTAAGMLTGGEASLAQAIAKIGVELGGSVALGAGAGLTMVLVLRYIHQKAERTLAISLGLLLLVIGASNAGHLDVILVTMTMGIVLVNAAPRMSERLFELIRSFSGPIYILFFVLVGARLQLSYMPAWLLLIVVLYVLLRSAGKMFGCWLGAKLSRAEPVVQKYTGSALFAQGGVAIGLSIMASQHLGEIQITEHLSLGQTIIYGVTATTMIVQLIGPSMVKFSIRRAGEMHRNITEQDVIASLRVEEAMRRNVPAVRDIETIQAVLRRFSEDDWVAYPVVDNQGRLAGVVTLTHLKDLLTSQETWSWMVVEDVLVPVEHAAVATAGLAEEMERMERMHADQTVVIDSAESMRPVGMLDRWQVQKVVNERLVTAQMPRPA